MSTLEDLLRKTITDKFATDLEATVEGGRITVEMPVELFVESIMLDLEDDEEACIEAADLHGLLAPPFDCPECGAKDLPVRPNTAEDTP